MASCPDRFQGSNFVSFALKSPIAFFENTSSNFSENFSIQPLKGAMTWPLVKRKDLLIGESKGPAILLTCGRGYACIFPQGAELPIWIPDRLIRHVAVPQTPGSSTAATTKKEKGHSSAPASATHLKSPADSKTIGSRDPRRTTH